MTSNEEQLLLDIEKINQISIVPTMLDVVCKVTGMGFAAIARVTEDRWIACSVRDEISFGLLPGGELKVKTTICDEVRGMHKAVIIDSVDEDEQYQDHDTPKMYGFKSYISVPIILKNGEFFGTLCAIDPRPAVLNNPKVIGMFDLFTELISFHLQSLDVAEKAKLTVESLSQQLIDSTDENRQYRHISSHNLQEPLRKIRVFSGLMITATEEGNMSNVKSLAQKINSSAQKLSMMIKDLFTFSEVSGVKKSFEVVNLNKVISDVCLQSDPQLQKRNAKVETIELPKVMGIVVQMEQLFFNLIDNAIKFARNDQDLIIKIDYKYLTRNLITDEPGAGVNAGYIRIAFSDNGIGIEKSQFIKIFDLFTKIPHANGDGQGFGLAYCRKIVRNHGGTITAESVPGEGTTFFLTLPLATTSESQALLSS